MWRRLGAALACLAFAGTVADGRQEPQATFRTSVHLVVQAVSVKDKNGRPVEGLTASDFVVTADGRRQEIAFVEYQPLDESPPPLRRSSSVCSKG